MQAFEKFTLVLCWSLLGAVCGFLCGMFAIQGWIAVFGKAPFQMDWSVISVLLGMGVAIALFTRSWMLGRLRNASYRLLAFVYFLISGVMFGILMLVPVFHPLLGIPAGYYCARRESETRSRRRIVSRCAHFTAAITLLWGGVSGWVAINDEFTAANLRGMLGWHGITQHDILWLVISGLPLLMGAQYAMVCLGAWWGERVKG